VDGNLDLARALIAFAKKNQEDALKLTADRPARKIQSSQGIASRLAKPGRDEIKEVLMRRLSVFLLFLAFLAPAALLADNSETSRAPVLIAEVSRPGDVRLLLMVYNDGEAILTRKDADEPDGELCSTFLPADFLAALEDTLRDAGALRLRDAEVIPDLTRKTISFFAGPDQQGRTHGNTFSYSRAEGPYLIVARAVSTVIDSHFGFCI
jgi:hypothetical protein